MHIPSDDVHVVPIDDYREHDVSKTCWCKPSPDTEESNVYLHKALDGREKYMTGELQLH